MPGSLRRYLSEIVARRRARRVTNLFREADRWNDKIDKIARVRKIAENECDDVHARCLSREIDYCRSSALGCLRRAREIEGGISPATYY